MSIFDKAGPLGEKIAGQSGSIFKNLENAAPQLQDLAERGLSLIKSIFSGDGGDSLNYPLDIEGNPAYTASVSFQIMEFRSAKPGKSQKSHLKQTEDNIASQKELDPQFSDFEGENEFARRNVATTEELDGVNTGFGNLNFQPSDAAVTQTFVKQKKDSKAENSELKKVDNTISPIGFFPKLGERTVQMFFPISQTFVDGVNYQTLGIGVTGAAAEQAIMQGSGGLSAATQAVFDDVKSATKAVLDKDFNVGPMGTELARFAAVRGANRFASGSLPAVSNITKMTVNPNIRTIFQGVNVREFTFTFKLIATSPQEGRVIQDIIKFFRRELYPKAFDVPVGKLNVDAKLGFNFPNAFKIRFNFKGIENQNLPRYKECYLRNMSHTINPTGGGFKVDGKPNEIDLTLSFVENQTLDRADIEAGF